MGKDSEGGASRRDEIEKILKRSGATSSSGLERLARVAHDMQAIEWELARKSAAPTGEIKVVE
jgi:hypothetical protein